MFEVNDRDKLLSDINFQKEYINFVNRMQEVVFNGEFLPNGVLQKNYTHVLESGEKKDYRFFAQSFQTEKEIWRTLTTGSELSEDELSRFTYSRMPKRQNMLLFLIEDVAISEDIYSDSVALFANIEVSKFQYVLIGMSAAIILYLVLFVLVLIMLQVVVPIT